MLIISLTSVPKGKQHSHAHRLLRECLKKRGIEYSEDTAITKNKYGKPSMTEYPEIFYNLSHAEGIAGCIVSDRECGIDCENVREYRPNVMKRAFTEAEQALVMNAPENEWNLMFFRLWTLKESYIKAIGMGLSFPMKNAEFSLKNGVISSNVSGYKFRQYILKDNKFIISICEKAVF